MKPTCPIRILLLVAICLSAPVRGADWVYTIAEGDNLWDFSARHLDTVLRSDQLRRINNIAHPKRMLPGTRIRVPMQWIRSNPVKARITAINGDVELLRNDGSKLENPDPATELGLGDTLRTGINSTVAIQFADKSRITLHQDSQLSFDHLSAHGTTGMVDSRVRLLDGRLETDVTPATGPGSRFEIHTPAAISAVRGTAYRAAVSEPKELSSFEVTGGRVAVSSARRSKLVRRGFGVQVKGDRPPGDARPLLAAPVLKPVPKPIRDPNWSLRWNPLSDAESYRVEIAPTPDFAILSWDREVSRPRTTLPELSDGLFFARVRGIDSGGLEGNDVMVGLQMDTHPRPPVPLKPLADEVVRQDEASLKWSASADADRYRLEIASDAGFTNLIDRLDDLTSTQAQATGTATPGTYHWRVYSIAADGEVGPASEARSWVVKPVPEEVEPALLSDDDRLTASWRPAEDDPQYRVQLAYDPDFADLQKDELTDRANFSFDATVGQVRYLRVRIVEQDGYEGPWSVAQRIDPPKDPTAWIIPALGILGILLL